jgi:hypothetical protein
MCNACGAGFRSGPEIKDVPEIPMKAPETSTSLVSGDVLSNPPDGEAVSGDDELHAEKPAEATVNAECRNKITLVKELEADSYLLTGIMSVKD